MENNNFVKLTMDSLVNNSIDVGIDFLEMSLDSILEDSILKEIPIVKTVYAISKTGFAIREKHMLKKTIIFLQQLNSNGVGNETYENYKQRLRENDEHLYNELEHVIIYIDRIVDERKMLILANLYYNYISGKFLWDQFLEMVNIVDNLFLSDLDELNNIYQKQTIFEYEVHNTISLNRLLTQNLISKIESCVREPDGSVSMYYTDGDYCISSLGTNLIRYGIISFK